MKLKANFHFHAQDDPQDVIKYTFAEGIAAAARSGFEIIALTCHHVLIDKPEYAALAAAQNILLIPGVEKDIERRHVVVLNAEKSIEQVNTFAELADYKKGHPESFIFAPHPYFGTYYCLGPELEKNIRLFDAIENSWFYSRRFNQNRKAEAMAKKYNLPFLAASDTHDLETLNKSYATVDAREKTIAAVFAAIKAMNFQNHSEPSRLFTEMLLPTVWGDFKKYRRKIFGR